MATYKAQSAGGKITALRQRQASLSAYYENPNRCKFCERVIEVRDNEKASETRRRQFCNSSCSASHNNRGVSRHKSLAPSKTCVDCGARVLRSQRCRSCHHLMLREIRDTVTRSELRAKTNSYQSYRSTLRAHAAKSFRRSGKEMSCIVCGYDNHVEVCHIRAVSNFPDDTTLGTINAAANLVALCPNHHWELDHDMLDLK